MKNNDWTFGLHTDALLKPNNERLCPAVLVLPDRYQERCSSGKDFDFVLMTSIHDCAFKTHQLWASGLSFCTHWPHWGWSWVDMPSFSSRHCCLLAHKRLKLVYGWYRTLGFWLSWPYNSFWGKTKTEPCYSELLVQVCHVSSSLPPCLSGCFPYFTHACSTTLLSQSWQAWMRTPVSNQLPSLSHFIQSLYCSKPLKKFIPMPLHQMVFSRTGEGMHSRKGSLQQMLLGKAEIHFQKDKRKP